MSKIEIRFRNPRLPLLCYNDYPYNQVLLYHTTNNLGTNVSISCTTEEDGHLNYTQNEICVLGKSADVSGGATHLAKSIF
jgi:hypothetical protein